MLHNTSRLQSSVSDKTLSQKLYTILDCVLSHQTNMRQCKSCTVSVCPLITTNKHSHKGNRVSLGIPQSEFGPNCFSIIALLTAFPDFRRRSMHTFFWRLAWSQAGCLPASLITSGRGGNQLPLVIKVVVAGCQQGWWLDSNRWQVEVVKGGW